MIKPRKIYTLLMGVVAMLTVGGAMAEQPTITARFSKDSVEVGDWVNAGDVIGLGGSTGRSTGPHLHFEITENDAPVDPLKYLK